MLSVFRVMVIHIATFTTAIVIAQKVFNKFLNIENMDREQK